MLIPGRLGHRIVLHGGTAVSPNGRAISIRTYTLREGESFSPSAFYQIADWGGNGIACGHIVYTQGTGTPMRHASF